VTAAQARPQIWTSSIGWIDPSDIECIATSDHTCTVKDFSDREPLAYVHANQSGHSYRYRIRAGTEIKVINDGINNEPTFESQNNENHWKKRVEVAIVIPSDWGKDGEIHPITPCHLITSKVGKAAPPIVELRCGVDASTAANARGMHEIKIQKGKECWSYRGNDRSFVGHFLSWQNITVKASFETDDGLKDATVKIYNLTNGGLEIRATQDGSYPTPEGGNATFEFDVQTDRSYKNIHFHICAITEKM
jgi:hypothetical protein